MKKFGQSALSVCALLCCLCGVSNADTLTNGDLIQVMNARASGQRTRGGPFRIEVKSGPATGDSFLTFCTELDENLYLQGSYYVTVSDQIWYGPPPTKNDYNPNDFSDKAAWLYETWLTSPGDLKTWAGDGGMSDATLNDAVQTLIWDLAGYETSYINRKDATSDAEVSAFLGYWGDGSNGWSKYLAEATGSVKVLNLWTQPITSLSEANPRYAAQDLLYYSTEFTAIEDSALEDSALAARVPEPSTLLCLLGGLGTFAVLRRRKKRRA